MAHFDVAIVGGGPGGSTCGTLLRKYDPNIKVAIFEREVFPRDHVGESQLPYIGSILDEMGVWDKVEAADFPIKIGATYRWGKTPEAWNFDFLPNGVLADESRPAKFKGQRTKTAFQVDRSIYDEILLDHAQELGCDVFQGCAVSGIEQSEDAITCLKLKDGQTVTADYYVDASGQTGLLRRALNIPVEVPSTLKNVAFWDYWQNAKWATNIGVGGTRIQVMSLGYGWIWFIPLGATRTSVGFVTHSQYYLDSGLKPEQLYLKALEDEPRVKALLASATSEEKFTGTKDWSFMAERTTGKNWMLVGEAAGFADPILSAGLTITHASAREAAYTILDLRRKENDPEWLLQEYNGKYRRRVLQHIRFADYWYSANAQASDLKAYTSQIAADAGLTLDSEAAFTWMGVGGFVDEDVYSGGFGTFTFNALHGIAERLWDEGGDFAYGGFNYFELMFEGAREVRLPRYSGGKIYVISGFERDKKLLPLTGIIALLVAGLQASPYIIRALVFIKKGIEKEGRHYDKYLHDELLQTLEAMIRDGWVRCEFVEGFEPLPKSSDHSLFISTNQD